MNIITLDVETTISNKGNPFDQTNKLVCVGLRRLNRQAKIIYIGDMNDLSEIQYEIEAADLLVGFNIKFDLHWLRKAGISIAGKRVWDCQLGEFILNDQASPYPSLDMAAGKYNFKTKLDVVKTEYWDKGIDTDQIPRHTLSEYLARDLVLTEQVFEKQLKLLREDKRYPLFRLQCDDLLVLEDMEYNGIIFDSTSALEKAKLLQEEIDEIYKNLIYITGDVPINLGSNDHVSALLYGGTISIDDRIPVGVYKTGAKTGETRYKIIEKVYELPRLVEPLRGTETKKSLEQKDVKKKTWEVNETTLRKVKLTAYAKKIMALISKYAEIEKLRGTYLEGYSKLINKMNWPKDIIHGNLNQCVVITGRLSSSKPNLQNCDPETKRFMRTRYE